jgi:signal transduction histidine kinase/CheY-like chemotaxis protein/purine-cytosine permease-like protein
MSAASPTQKIFRIRRDYNTWVANETLEDYALRYTPRGFRKWSEFRVANTAFGAVSFLALEAIGGAIALNYGFSNAVWAILVVGIVIYLTGLPIAVYAARYGVDMDLLTRGAGFGYLGSTLTSLIYASFTFIFFALEAAIMALAIQMAFGWPLVWCYVLASLVIIPLVLHGITLISRLQAWTQPLWLVLFLWPFVWIALERPQLFVDFTGLTGRSSGSSGFQPLMFGAAATVAFSLVVQIGEQVDFLRFLPARTAENKRRWWTAVLVSGPGWVVPGALKMLGGAFLAFVALQHEVSPEHAVEPTQMYLAGFQEAFRGLPVPGLALAVTVLFVIVSQVKINVTNAYAGSLAWSNFFARLTHSHPGRVVWLVFNVVIAVLLMTLGVFGALEKVLGVYSNAWVGALVADLVINNPLGWSPPGIEFRRAYLYDLNPVGLGAMVCAAALACVAFGGLLGETAQAFSSFIALGTAMVVSPLLAWATGGRWYLARTPSPQWLPGEMVRCSVCENSFESEDIASCPAYGAPICSLCCTLESRCHDRCKTRSRAAEQIRDGLGLVLPDLLSRRVNFRVAHYLVVFTAMCALMVFVLGVVYVQESVGAPGGALDLPFVKVFALMALMSAVCAWWVVLASESRRMAHDESSRQTELLQREIDAHRRTDVALQGAKDLAEAANSAKTRYVAGMTHELRTPLNSILGYAQILLKDPRLGQEDHRWLREALGTMQHSGQHMHALIDGLLDLARIEAGRVRLDVAPLPLPEFLDDVLRMVQPQATAKGIALVQDGSGRLPAWVRADAKRLRQILINLLGNAVVFTDHGSVTLRVDCRHDVLRFEVIDTGIGIAPQDQERIFLPFERGSAGRRLAEPGTGLGLTITHLLTELMGGELSVTSELGVGSTFSVRLYLREIVPQQFDPPPRAADLRPVIGYIGPRRTLLVVDDQPIQRQLLAALLMPLGFIVREAASGREGLDIIAQQRPDAVLLDVSMDDLDGWQTAELIRESEARADPLGPALPIIFVSANMFENRPEQLAALRCEGFVGKPVVESELLEVLARALQLEWVHQTPLSGLTHGPRALPAPAAAPPVWPEDEHAELLRLARLGHAQGLKTLLQQTARQRPTLAHDCATLRACVDRFDFDALILALMQRSTPEPADESS